MLVPLNTPKVKSVLCTLIHRYYTGGMEQKPYPSDVSGDEWAFVAPYLTQNRHPNSDGVPQLL